MKKRVNLFILILAFLLGIGVARYCSAQTYNNLIVPKGRIHQNIASTKDVVEISKIINTINLVDNNWVGDKNLEKSDYYQAALKGIMNNLDDPYSDYLTVEEHKDMNDNISGTYSGVGMSIKKKKGEYLEVVSPFVGSPAFKAGIQPGDKVMSIDGKSVVDLSASESSKLLRGKKGTKVQVEVIKPKAKKPLKLTLVRDNIQLEIVDYKMLDDKIGYISLSEFDIDASTKVSKAIADLKKQGMKELIFDLRTNPGGVLQEAAKIGSIFVPNDKQMMVSLNYKDGTKKVFNRIGNQQFDGKMVVLVNSGSASASEIVTGILKDYNRATIIGEKTFGKGVAQQVIPFNTGDAIKITIAKYSTPKNDDINKKGIEPDIYIKMDPALSIKGYANETEIAKKNRMEQIREILVEINGKEKAEEIIAKGDTQLKAAQDFLNGKKVISDKKEDDK